MAAAVYESRPPLSEEHRGYARAADDVRRHACLPDQMYLCSCSCTRTGR